MVKADRLGLIMHGQLVFDVLLFSFIYFYHLLYSVSIK